MLKLLKIENFQSHSKTELEFAPGVNVIVGTSDSGKTAIIRSLRWLIWNRPSGDAIRSTWGGPTSVGVSTSEGTSILRSKDKVDTYRMYGGEHDLDFKAFGTSVPEEVQGVLNMSEVNLQGQLDAPFLLSDTPGAVALHFNKVARLDKIDTGLQNVQRAIRELENTIKYKKEDVEKKEAELLRFEHLDKFEAEVEVLEQMQQHKTAATAGINRLTTLVGSIVRVEQDMEADKIFIGQEPQVDGVLVLYMQRREREAGKARLYKSTQELQTIEDEVAEGEELVEVVLPLVDKILVNITKIGGIQARYAPLSRVVNTLLATQTMLLQRQEILGEQERRFHREMPAVCPLCEQPIRK